MYADLNIHNVKGMLDPEDRKNNWNKMKLK